MDSLRKHWYDIGGLIAMVVIGGLALFGQGLSFSQQLLLLNYAALLVHQFEEYRFPGFFPGHYNGGVFKSPMPDRYPLNTQSALVVNIGFGWPIYLIPVFLPQYAWLGLAPVLFGFGQVVIHGVVFPLRVKRAYSPGILSAVLLHLPIGIAYILAIQPTGFDWLIAFILLPLVTLSALVVPIRLFQDKDTPHRFAERQMGPYVRDEH